MEEHVSGQLRNVAVAAEARLRSEQNANNISFNTLTPEQATTIVIWSTVRIQRTTVLCVSIVPHSLLLGSMTHRSALSSDSSSVFVRSPSLTICDINSAREKNL